MVRKFKIRKKQLKKSSLLTRGHFDNDNIKVIGLSHAVHTDTSINKLVSFENFIKWQKHWPIIVIENANKIIKSKNIIDIHVFIHNKAGYSFSWHKDETHVFLYVIKGKKIVDILNKKVLIKQNQGIFIPAKTMHKVRSIKGTVALSIALKTKKA
jgi:glyoxylate utilization-related uncharacterized protein